MARELHTRNMTSVAPRWLLGWALSTWKQNPRRFDFRWKVWPIVDGQRRSVIVKLTRPRSRPGQHHEEHLWVKMTTDEAANLAHELGAAVTAAEAHDPDEGDEGAC